MSNENDEKDTEEVKVANTSANVTQGKPATVGALYVGTSEATLPTNPATAVGSGWACLGYISEDGITNSQTKDSASVKAWGGDTVLTTQTGFTDTFKWKLLETMNLDVLKTVYGATNVTKDSSSGLITVKVNSDEPLYNKYVIDMVLKGSKLKRIVIPSAKLTSLGDISYKDSEATGYEMTLTAEPDTNGQTHYEYISAKDPE